MNDWEENLTKGKKCIDNDEYLRAQDFLEQALEGCPDEDSSAAAEILFEIGRSFFGRGMRGIAIRNMLSAVKLGASESHARNMLKYLVNEYGMPAQKTADMDDEAAFSAIHILRYLHTKKSASFGTKAERDMISDLIFEAWTDFKTKNLTTGLNTREKIQKFREYVIIFPSFSVPVFEESAGGKVFYPDFGTDLCSCGSGLPYMWCCGRIKSVEELDDGLF